MLPNDPQSRVTLEDLLHLKRAERPEPEFWTRFERDLREKQLTALLEKRPWWQGLGRTLLRRAYLPAGGAAALAVGLITLRQPAPVAQTPVAVSPVATQKAESAVQTVAAAERPAATAPEAMVNHAGDATAAAPVVMVATTVPRDVAEMIPWSAPRAESSPSARSIAANLARLEQTEPELLETVLNVRTAQPVRVQSAAARPPVELASITVSSPRGSSSRLLAGYSEREFAPEPTAPDLVRERLARRLADPELLDQIRRLDLKGNRVSLKL